MSARRFLELASVVLLVACEAEPGGFVPGSSSGDSGTEPVDSGDPPDSGEPAVGVRIVEASYVMDSTEWRYDATLEGAADQVTLDIYQAMGGQEYEEAHGLARTGEDPKSSVEYWEATLQMVDQGGYVHSEASEYSCCEMNETSMTWMLQALVANEVEHCVVWGADEGAYAKHGCDSI